MEIKIKTSCEEEKEKVLFHIERFCRENFRDCSIYIDDNLEKELKWK